MVIRTAAVLVVLSLSTPSMAVLACEWSCASAHAATTSSTGGGCHEHEADSSQAPAIGAAHACHDLVELPDTIVTAARQIDTAAAVVWVPHAALATSTARVTFDSVAPPIPLDPVLLRIPLRI